MFWIIPLEYSNAIVARNIECFDMPRPRLVVDQPHAEKARAGTGLEIRESIISSCRTIETFKHRRHLHNIKTQELSKIASNKSTDNSDGVRRILYTCRLSACPVIAAPSLP